MMISTLVSSQKLRLISSTIRVNVQFTLIWKLRNAQELASLLEELSAIYPIDVLKAMYDRATQERFSCWYVNFLPASAQKEDMFYLRFDGGHMVPAQAKGASSGTLSQAASLEAAPLVAPSVPAPAARPR